MPQGAVEVDHPLIRHHVAQLRDVSTPSEHFRTVLRRLTVLLAYEATKDLPLANYPVTTPIATTVGARLDARVGIVPILRAGLGMVDAVLDFLPEAEVWHLGLYRDEATARPVEYYSKLPTTKPVDVALVVDPMLATGGSALSAIESMQRWGVSRIKLVSVIASRAGIERVHAAAPEVQIFVAAIDPALNDQHYIVPGLGDAGDRIFQTLR